MIPENRISRLISSCMPRASGDDPYYSEDVPFHTEYAPRERG